jgi:hypothetical protein
MTTKAQQFRNEQTRAAMLAKPKAAPKRKPRANPDGADAAATAPPDASAPTRRADARGHAGRRGGSVLEPPVTAGARPSRKSTRKSADHVKQSTNLQLKASRASAAPTTRATRGAQTTQKAKAQAKPAAATRAPARGRARAR